MTFHFPLERDGVEIDAEVECEWHKPIRGARDSLGGVRNAGPPLEPDEDGFWEVIGVTGEDGKPIVLDIKEYDRIVDKAHTYGNDD